jgi:2-oxo-4-hydroxy-4-carboxy--5-ureidoimidazoline (OHCU) decarboxylase
VGGDLYCGDLYFNDNTLSERAIKTVLERMFRKGFTLEQAVKDKWRYIPKEDKLYLAKHHPDLSQEKKAEYEALGRFKRRVI